MVATSDVPGANPANRDRLAMGSWAEHSDGSLIFVESVEGGDVVYVIFDVSQDPPVQYRDAMPEGGFKQQFTWRPGDDDDDNVHWIWHDKTPFPWDRVMSTFPSGTSHASAVGTMTAAQRVADRLNLRAEAVQERHEQRPTQQVNARSILTRIRDVIDELLH